MSLINLVFSATYWIVRFIFWLIVAMVCHGSISGHPANITRSGRGVGILIFFFGIFGLIYYFIVKGNLDNLLAIKPELVKKREKTPEETEADKKDIAGEILATIFIVFIIFVGWCILV